MAGQAVEQDGASGVTEGVPVQAWPQLGHLPVLLTDLADGAVAAAGDVGCSEGRCDAGDSSPQGVVGAGSALPAIVGGTILRRGGVQAALAYRTRSG